MKNELLNVTKKSGYVLLSIIIFALLNFIFDFVAARFLGAAIYGKFVYIYSFLVFLSYFVLLGINNGLVYYIPKFIHNNESNKLFNIINFYVFIITILSIFISLILIIKSSWITKNILNNINLSSILKISSPLIILIVITCFYQSVLKGLEEIFLYAFTRNFFEPLIRVIFIIIFIILGFKVLGLIFSYILSFLLCLILILYKLIKKNKIFSYFGKIYSKDTIDILKYSFPLLFSGLLFILMTKVDVFMIGFFLEEKWVGIYNIAIRLGTFSAIVYLAIKIVFKPVISRLYHKNKNKELENLNKTLSKWIFGSNFIVFLIVLIFNKEIMKIFGNEFLLGSFALILITCSQTIKSSVGASGLIIIMTGYSVFDFYINLIAVLVNIVLNILFIPRLGINGAAIAFLVSLLLNNVLKVLFVLKVHKIHPYNKGYIKLLYLSLIPFVIIYCLKNMFRIEGFIYFIVFTFLFLAIFGFLYFFHGMSDDDKLIIKAVKKKLFL